VIPIAAQTGHMFSTVAPGTTINPVSQGESLNGSLYIIH